MCISPNKTFVNGHGLIDVPCRDCQRCRYNRVEDWIGRCQAEAHTSEHTVRLTLTYAPREREDVGIDPTTLDYKDVQRMLYRLRNRGHELRYIVTGEHGSLKGRAHWHIIIFFKTNVVPLLQYNKECWDWEHFWPHGFTYAELPTYKGFRYCLKYCLKELTPEGDPTGKDPIVRMSKKPILGYDHIKDLAWRAVDAGSPIKKPTYRFEGITYEAGPRKGQKRVFFLSRRAAEIFKEEFLQRWFSERAVEWFPRNDMLLKFQMKKGNQRFGGHAEEMLEMLQAEGRSYPEALRQSLTRLEARPTPPVRADKVLTAPDGPAGEKRQVQRGQNGKFYLVGLAWRDWSECHEPQELAIKREVLHRARIDQRDCERSMGRADTQGQGGPTPAKLRYLQGRVADAEEGLRQLVQDNSKLEERWRFALESRSEIRAALEGRVIVLDHRTHIELPEPLGVQHRSGNVEGVHAFRNSLSESVEHAQLGPIPPLPSGHWSRQLH